MQGCILSSTPFDICIAGLVDILEENFQSRVDLRLAMYGKNIAISSNTAVPLLI